MLGKLSKYINDEILNQRKDMLRKVSNQLINENQVIVIEDLKVSSMIKNHKLAKSIERSVRP